MIYVFGGINLDIVAKVAGNVRMNESNIANVSLKAGGVGRNIARAIGNFTLCEFLTCVPNSLYNPIIKELEDNNVSLKYSKFLNDESSLNIYIDVLDDKGVVLGACDTKALNMYSINDIKNILEIINDNDVVVIDANIPELAEYITYHTKGFKILDAVSSIKLQRIKHIVKDIDFIKVNNFEFEIIKEILPKNYLITTGNGGQIVFNGENLIFKHKELIPINPTGCGDTFLGTFIGNMNLPLKDAISLSIKAAAVSSQSLDAVPTKKQIDDYNIKELEIKWNQ